MAAPETQNPFFRAYREIQERVQGDKHDDDSLFVTYESLKEIWHYELLRDFFVAHKVPISHEQIAFVRKNSLRMLSILVDIYHENEHQGLRNAELWLSRLIAEPPLDPQLPLEPTVLKDMQLPLPRRFNKDQYKFVPAVIRGAGVIQRIDKRRLPFVEEPRNIGEGGFGEVFRVKIAEGYFQINDEHVNQVS